MAPRKPEESERLREERRRQIMRSALALFAERGLHDTTVSDIAARAEVSQGTVYWYFESKDELFEAAFVDGLESLLAPMFDILADESLSPSRRLMQTAEVSLEVFADHPELAFLVLQVIATQGVAAVLAHDFEEYYERFGGLVAPLFEQLGDPNPAATATLYLSLLDGLMMQRLVSGERFDSGGLTEQIRVKFNLEEER